MDTITFGLFRNQESAENAIHELNLEGFSLQDISIVMKDQDIIKEIRKNTGAHGGEGLLANLIKLGLPQRNARICEAKINSGCVLIGVQTNSPENTVRSILEKHRASQIRSINKNIL